MRLDFKEDAILIDNVINVESHKFIQKDLFDMQHTGEAPPTELQMPIYVQAVRESIQATLEQNN